MNFSRIIGLAALAAIGMITAASASDLTPVARKAPAQAGFSWTGLYAGFSGGAGIMDNGPSLSKTGTLSSLIPNNAGNHPKGWMLGGQVGYRYQPNFVVYGIKGTFHFADLSVTDSASSSQALLTGTSSGSSVIGTKLKWLSTAVATLGVTPLPNVLLELQGGFAFGKVQTDAATAATAAPFTNTSSLTCFFSGCSSSGSASDSTVRTGWTVGGGAEVAMNRNWSLRGEANYFDIGSGGVAFAGTSSRSAVTTNVEYRGWNALLGVNYKFN